MEKFSLQNTNLTKYLFFTGKGGVGKTSIASAISAALADSGKKVLLVSTDPASNLQDIFCMELTNKSTAVVEVPGLFVANLDPIQAAAEYRESVVAPYRGKLPESVIANMEEQLSGSCTVEIAAFNEFSAFITDENAQTEYDHIIFDTAPTGHTLRMLQLPSAWSNFISENTHGASCLGPLSGLESKKDVYRKTVKALTSDEMTTLILVSRPEVTPLKEVERVSLELIDLGINNQLLLINGVLDSFDDAISENLYTKQQAALADIPIGIKNVPVYTLPMRAYNITGVENIRNLLIKDNFTVSDDALITAGIPKLSKIIDDISDSGKKVIFTMGKGGVGKTSVAAAIAIGLAAKGKKVHLTTTDPADHLKYVINEASCFTISHINEKEELLRYKEEVISKARETMHEDDIAYIEEDLRSPCTQEIAVFRAFAEIVERAEGEVVVIDTAPTGHTLLLLDATQSYHREVKRTKGDIPEPVKKLLPRLRNASETAVIIVTLAETTPVYEAMRLDEELKRAGIATKWWVINSSLYMAKITNRLLMARASHEIKWINKVYTLSHGNCAVIEWSAEDINGDILLTL